MIRRLLNRKALKAIAHRQKSLYKLMETCQKHMEALPADDEARKTWERMYWDAWVREEELSSLRGYLEGE
jgi:hypothetical protein